MRGWEDNCAIAEVCTGRDRLGLVRLGDGCGEYAVDGVVSVVGDEFTWIGDHRSRADVLADGEDDCCRLGDGWTGGRVDEGVAGAVVDGVHKSYIRCCEGGGFCAIKCHRLPSELPH